MKAKSIKGKSPEEIQSALQLSMTDGFKPTLAIVFLTSIENTEAVQAILTKENITIFGASTSEKFTEAGMESDDIVGLLLDINTNYFRIALKEYAQSSPFEAAKQIGEAGMQAFKQPGFIISSVDIGMLGEDLINGLTNATGERVTIMGGVAGSPADFSGIVFTNDILSTGGILALVFDENKIAISGLAVSGWKPVGTEKKITKSEGAWIFTIDDEPALNVIQRFLGNEIISSDKQRVGLLPSDLGYPLQFKRPSGSILMKPLLVWNTADKSIMLGGQVKEGESFRFSLPPDFDVIDKVVESTRIAKEKDMPDADALIVFSCVGRLGSFGPMISTEIEGLAATWNKPMIGFFSLGEFGKLDNGTCEFHGTTVSWVALKEKSFDTPQILPIGRRNNNESKINQRKINRRNSSPHYNKV